METVQGGVPPYGVKETLVVNGGKKLGSMLLRTGSQSVSVQRTARSMVLVVSFSCMSTRLVCAEFLQTGAQYSATY